VSTLLAVKEDEISLYQWQLVQESGYWKRHCSSSCKPLWKICVYKVQLPKD
jgi:hypothetical protein